MKTLYAIGGACALAACATATIPAVKEGLVEYYGSQKTIFDTGKAEAKVPLAAMSGPEASFGVGAVAGLDGEITVFDGKPYVTKVRGKEFTMDHGRDHAAVFSVWTKNTQWRDELVPASVKSYLDLQRHVKVRAAAAGIDTNQPFPFLLAGTPAELKWHINVDRTEGKPVTRELFAKSKVNYTMKGTPVDIVGFYSEKHLGAFIGTYVPAIKEKDVKNTIHIHLVSKDGKSAGHIDDLTFAGGMTLRLPKN
ncbi:acetolactate decarboxylase [Sulfuritalea sp.]|uniref:acetolactate decarboxylase n=1 Tax=Sulfuritalea sp. TaxID=2480090 RepID=UPI001ACA2417|nr:acetolactate decarboxylase [Sulfuritalea sp.]MBN8475495.1 acetolactate decarboxylase [Sulfuritalea sp.]